MSEAFVTTTQEESLLWLTLNRPDKRNPLSSDMIAALSAALRARPNLVAYCERVTTAHFGPMAPLEPPPKLKAAGPNTSGGAGTAAADAAANAGDTAASASNTGKTPRTAKQQAFRRRSRNAVFAAAGAALLYALGTDALASRAEEDESDDDAGG